MMPGKMTLVMSRLYRIFLFFRTKVHVDIYVEIYLKISTMYMENCYPVLLRVMWLWYAVCHRHCDKVQRMLFIEIYLVYFFDLFFLNRN